MRAFSAQNMSPRIRSLTILLVIELTIEFQVSAFTLRRASLEPVADLAGAETARAKLAHDSIGNTVKVIDIKHDDMSQKLPPSPPVENAVKTEDIQKTTTNEETVSTTESVKDDEITENVDNAVTTTRGDTETHTTEGSQTTSESTKDVDITTQDTTQTILDIKNDITTPTTETNEPTNTEVDDSQIISKHSSTVVDENTTVFTTFTLKDSETVTDATNTATDVELTTENKQVEILEGEYSSPTVPPFKKQYTSLDRKRTTHEQEGTTNESERLVSTDTSRPNIIVDKGFNTETNIPSLEKLKQQIFSASNVPLSTQAAVGVKEYTAILSSVRAGFLDHSKPTAGTTNKEDDVLTAVSSLSVNANHIVSQSQLAEDAINEELLKEDVLNNNVNGDSFGVQRLEIKQLDDKSKDHYTVIANTPGPAQVPSSSEEKLSVKPINADRQKSGVYTVSPNYKPMKKLEIQQPKQYIRDPDDNSWRNESISSLGIVFKANNSTKPLTQVLKNKTQTVMNSTEKTDSKDESLELRDRLGKIAETRKKSKKKKIGKDGGTIYTDYDSVEITKIPVQEIYLTTSAPAEPQTQTHTFTYSAAPPETETFLPAPSATSAAPQPQVTTYKAVDLTKDLYEMTTPVRIRYQTNDDDDDEEIDYIRLSNIDLKKFSAKSGPPPQQQQTPPNAKPVSTFNAAPSRQATIQYFPPRTSGRPVPPAPPSAPSGTPTVSFNEYDTNFQRLNEYTTTREPLTTVPVPVPVYTTPDSIIPGDRLRYSGPPVPVPVSTGAYTAIPVPVETDDPNFGIALIGPEQYNKASYVIKHLRDFLNQAAKDEENPRLPPATTNAYAARPGDYFDYEYHRKDALDRFVDNFNQNSERFKVDFPVVYNTSVIHPGGREPASSSAFVKRLYETVGGGPLAGGPARCEPSCERTVELAPEYELHYYVPEQEERELRDDVTRRIQHRPQHFGRI